MALDPNYESIFILKTNKNFGIGGGGSKTVQSLHVNLWHLIQITGAYLF
jgi:hypothetical protein